MQTKLNQSRPYGQAEPTLPGKAGEGQHEYFVSLAENLLLYEYALTRQESHRYAKSELFQRLGMGNYPLHVTKDSRLQKECDYFNELNLRWVGDILSDALSNLSKRELLSHNEDDGFVEITYNHTKLIEGIAQEKEELANLIDDTKRKISDNLPDYLRTLFREYIVKMRAIDFMDCLFEHYDDYNEDGELGCMGASCVFYYSECDGTRCLQDDCDFDLY